MPLIKIGGGREKKSDVVVQSVQKVKIVFFTLDQRRIYLRVHCSFENVLKELLCDMRLLVNISF